MKIVKNINNKPTHKRLIMWFGQAYNYGVMPKANGFTISQGLK